MSESLRGEADSPSNQDGKVSSVCPTCGDSFKNIYGMKQHHAKAHGESLVYETYECDYCGSEVKKQEYRKRNGAKSFCDKDCQGKYYQERVGEDHPLYGHVTVECEYCGEETKRKPSRLERHDRLFCSQSCYGRWRSDNICGKNHHQYNGYQNNEYGPNWHKQRRKARDRDQHRCQRCLKTPKELGQEPDVHHKKKISWFKENYDQPEWWEKGNDLDNLITLCRSCHGLWEDIPLDLDVRLG